MSFYTSSTIASLATTANPFPVINPDATPYNFYDTPFFGNPNTVTNLNTATFTYNINGTPVNVTWPQMVTYMQTNLPSGSGPGTQGEVTAPFLAARWQEFFYYFQPLIDNTIFSNVVASVEDPGINYANFNYYQNLFKRCFSQWMGYRHTNSSTDAYGSSLITYLKNNDITPAISPTTPINDQPALNNNMQYRQKAVMMWQFIRIVGMIQRLNLRAIQAGERDVIWNRVNVTALEAMINTPIPATTGSSEDVTIPDPTSVALQNAATIVIEGYRGNYKAADQRAQMEEATVSFASDAVSQQRQSLSSFWDSLDTIMNAMLN